MKRKLHLAHVLYASILLSVSATAAPTPITPAQLGASHVTFSASGNLSSNPSPGAFGYAFPYLICPPGIGGWGGSVWRGETHAGPRLTGQRATLRCGDTYPTGDIGLRHNAHILIVSNN